MADTGKVIYVYENWSANEPKRLGCLYVDYGKGREHYSFEYDENWLKSGFAHLLDPDLALYKGRQYPINKAAFGLFADSSPDRWGRVLMKRRERFLADREGRKPRKLTDSDFLLGVYDKTRMGALRFRKMALFCPTTRTARCRPGRRFAPWRRRRGGLRTTRTAWKKSG